MNKYLITQLKEEFYAWCSMLSIDEIASNGRLMRAMERMERRLLREECKAKVVVR